MSRANYRATLVLNKSRKNYYNAKLSYRKAIKLLNRKYWQFIRIFLSELSELISGGREEFLMFVGF
jgi:hypothetical protein